MQRHRTNACQDWGLDVGIKTCCEVDELSYRGCLMGEGRWAEMVDALQEPITKSGVSI